ncbi:hypothetical protein [Dehalobacterium formicoaceticum]|uniref:hypothetical protein n=1 Tax=Dehalobacterium formicoaceticum TaxID=51515 RepID=UPI0031F6D341
MKSRKVEWTRLDNASKIFPATYDDKDPKVFRVACELTEDVHPKVLQRALDITMESFTLYKAVLRRGVFWYYLESSDIRPIVEMESKPVCAPIYFKDRKDLLFRVFYYHNRINMEIFHALSDGTGALWFMQNMVHHYLVMKHKKAFACKIPELQNNVSLSEKMNDSFIRHFTGDHVFQDNLKNIKKIKSIKAYQIRGARLEENRTLLIEGSMSVKAVLEEAHKYKSTLTIFIASVFIYAIYKGMTARGKKHPVTLTVPVNLRQFFESETARNFFTTINVGSIFTKENVEIEEIIAAVKEGFKEGMKKEQLAKQLNQYIALEKNLVAKVIPLPLKDYALRIADKVIDREITGAISNIGRITMPLEFDHYIKQFSFCTSARRPQITMCSYGDRLVISFTSPFKETEIQKTFFQFLSKRGIEVEISSNV